MESPYGVMRVATQATALTTRVTSTARSAVCRDPGTPDGLPHRIATAATRGIAPNAPEWRLDHRTIAAPSTASQDHGNPTATPTRRVAAIEERAAG